MMHLRTICFLVLSVLLVSGIPALAQVTHGMKPNLPAPFATKSAGNGPSEAKPPAGFLPTVPAGFQVNILRRFEAPEVHGRGAKRRYFRCGNRRLANHHSSRLAKFRGPQQTEVFVGKLNRPFGIAFREGYVYVATPTKWCGFATTQRLLSAWAKPSTSWICQAAGAISHEPWRSAPTARNFM